MSIVELPHEILHNVIELTIPEAFEDVVLTCKKFLDIGSTFLEKHNRLRRRFRHFGYSGHVSNDMDSDASQGSDSEERLTLVPTKAIEIGINTPIELVQFIAAEPIAARYILTADLTEDMLPELDSELDDNGTGRALVGENGDTLLELLRSSPYIAETGCSPEHWLQAIHTTLQGHVDTFVLTLLPNVTTLSPSPRLGKGYLEEECWLILDAIVRNANDKTTSDAALSRLESVQPFADPGYNNRYSLSTCAPFLALNSIRRFRGISCIGMDDGYTGIIYEPRYETYSHNLTELTLTSSLLDCPSTRDLLSRLPNLRVFRFGKETKWHGCGYNWNVGAMLAIIQELTDTTLEELSLHDIGGSNSLGSTLVNMKGFQCLRILELDLDMLIGPSFDPEEEYEDDDASGDPAFPRLVDLLPTTIESIRLVANSWRPDRIQCVKKLFDGFEEERNLKVPYLKNIVLHTDSQVYGGDVPPAIKEEALQIFREHGGRVTLEN